MPVITDARTLGISPKAVLAFMYPFLATLLAVVAAWIVTGNFDVHQVQLAAGGLVLSISAALGAFVGSTGRTQLPATQTPPGTPDAPAPALTYLPSSDELNAGRINPPPATAAPGAS